MNDEQVPAPEENQETPETPEEETLETPSAPSEDSISLSKAEYNQMMATMATMQAMLSNQQAPSQEEAAAPPPPSQEDINKMSQAELVQYVQQSQQPMLQTIMNMAVQLELRDVQDKYNDFKEYKDDVYQEAQANPSLSLEQAYLIAKSRKTGKQPPKPQNQNPAPKQAAAPPPPAQRTPAPTPESMTQDEKLSAHDAAVAAAKALGIE